MGAITPADNKIAALAREIAIGIYPLDQILLRLKISPAEFRYYSELPQFQSLLDQMAVEWGQTKSTTERIKVKALAGLEDGLSELCSASTNAKEPLSSRVEAFKLLRVLGGIADKSDTPVMGERFTLTINIGDGRQRTIDVTPGPQNLRQDEPTLGVSLNADMAGGIE